MLIQHLLNLTLNNRSPWFIASAVVNNFFLPPTCSPEHLSPKSSTGQGNIPEPDRPADTPARVSKVSGALPRGVAVPSDGSYSAAQTMSDEKKENLALSIAVLIDRDPEMAAKIKQFIPDTRLAALLGLSLPLDRAA